MRAAARRAGADAAELAGPGIWQCSPSEPNSIEDLLERPAAPQGEGLHAACRLEHRADRHQGAGPRRRRRTRRADRRHLRATPHRRRAGVGWRQGSGRQGDAGGTAPVQRQRPRLGDARRLGERACLHRRRFPVRHRGAAAVARFRAGRLAGRQRRRGVEGVGPRHYRGGDGAIAQRHLERGRERRGGHRLRSWRCHA